MTRKDTIMIAVLVNAALLIALFVSAIKNDDVTQEKIVAEVKPIALPEQPKKEIKTAQGDEVDQVLKEFAAKEKSPEEKAAKKIDFAKELEAITKAASEPAKKAVVPVKAAGSFATVTVQKGDALEKIARNNNISVNEIIDANNLKSTVLQVGQVLKIPGKSTPSVQKASIQNAEYYTVKTGDNPWAIAVKNKLKLDELLKLNDLNEEKARRLKPGDTLRIR